MEKGLKIKDDVKVVIITGANRGIGLATVKKFSEEGWWIYACVRHTSKSLEMLIKNKGKIQYMDLSDEQSIADCAKLILKNTKRVDALVNCGGIAFGSLFSMTKICDLKKYFK